MTEDRTIQFIKDVLLNGNDPRGKEAEKNLRWSLNEYLNEQLILHGVVVNGAKEQNSIKKEYLNESDKIAIKNKKDSEMELCDHPSEYARKYGSTEVCGKCGKTWG